MNTIVRRSSVAWTARLDIAAWAVLGLLLSHATPLAAQPRDYEPLPEGFVFHLQAGFAWSTLRDVEPLDANVSFGSRRSLTYLVRVSRVMLGPVAAFTELGTAQRGAEIVQPGEPTFELRSRWYDTALGFNVAARCFSGVCPSLDAGVGFGFHRESVFFDPVTGRPTGTFNSESTETAALLGLRVASARLSGLAAVLRVHEGLTDLPSDGSRARNRSIALLLSFPLTQ